MQQRQLRLGDIVDDYCPRERRITNHAVVAMVDQEVKRSRCTTCDAEHEYKNARVPASRRKKEAPSSLYKQVLAEVQGDAEASVGETTQSEPAPPSPPPAADRQAPERVEAAETAEAAEAAEGEAEEEAPDAGAQPTEDEGPVHRRLIRATLPRPEGGTSSARPVPQFTLRQSGGRGNNFHGSASRAGGRGHSTQGAGRPRPGHAGGSRPGGAAGRDALTRHVALRPHDAAGRHSRPSRPGQSLHHGKKHSK